jgi:HEAT repeat protein
MNLLTIVTTTAAILTVLSIILLLLIILLRIFTERKLERESDFRKRALPVLIAFAEGKADAETTLAILGKDPSLSLQLLMEESDAMGRERSHKIQPLFSGFAFEKQMIKDLKSRNWQRRLHSADRLGYIGGERAIPALMTALRDELIGVRFAAARSLTRLECSDSVESILHSLDVPGEVSQRRVAEILFPLGTNATEPILGVLENPSVNDAALSIAARVAGMLHMKRAVPSMTRLLSHQVVNVRLNCIRSLASIKESLCISGIAALAEDPSWEVRCSVMQALGRLDAREQIPLLVQALSDQQWWVRHNAGEALIALGDQGIKSLEEASEHHVDAYGRDMSRQILQQHGHLKSTQETLT